MGLANWLTTLRILLIPVFVTLLVYRKAGWAFAVFCAASLTDMLDGYIARTRGTQTRLGAFLDPVADKLLITSAFVTLTYLKVIPFWIAAVVVSRDLILSVGVLVIHVAGGTVHPTPSLLGKASTVFQMATVLSAMLAYYFRTLMFLPKTAAWITVIFTVGSGLQYLVKGLGQLNPPDAPPGLPSVPATASWPSTARPCATSSTSTSTRGRSSFASPSSAKAGSGRPCCGERGPTSASSWRRHGPARSTRAATSASSASSISFRAECAGASTSRTTTSGSPSSTATTSPSPISRSTSSRASRRSGYRPSTSPCMPPIPSCDTASSVSPGCAASCSPSWSD